MMILARFYTYLCLIMLFHTREGARILGIFSLPFRGHFNYYNGVMKSLAEADHEVTVTTPFPELASKHNYTKIISFPKIKMFSTESTIRYDEFVIQNVMKFMDLTIHSQHQFCNELLNLSEIQKILKSEKKFYDVVFIEIQYFHQCYLPVVEKMNVPLIGLTPFVSSSIADSLIYNSNNPAYIGDDVGTRKWPMKSVIGRLLNVWNRLVVDWYTNYVTPNEIEKFHQNHVDLLGNLEKYKSMKPALIFYNNHATLLPRPMNPNADIAGIHIENAKPLPKNIQKFIDEADRGVILFAFGSLVRAAKLSNETQNSFREAFAEIPQRVVWKFEEKIVNLSDNVMLMDWLPQRDILEHKNVIVFITHCGLGSITEAIYTATKMITCPLFGDQLNNAELLEDQEVAVHLDIDDITKENVLNALNKVVNESKYSENMQKLSKEFKDRPLTPQQQVVYWTEHVIRNNGAPSLKSVANRLNWIQRWLLDVVFIVLISLVAVVYLVGQICRIFYSVITRLRKLKNKNE